jgi:WbqC-like protein family
MPKRVAILQSNYIPWKGYFDLIHDVDEFVFLDDVQYTRQDWRNRNRIKTDRGAAWLTIPVGTRLDRRICDVPLPARWADAHWRQLVTWYASAPHFETFRPLLEEIFLGGHQATLSELNQQLIRAIAGEVLGIAARFRDSRELGITSSINQDRVLDILAAVGATTYVSGPAARAYIDERRFAEAGLELIWKDYSGYPEYPQFYPPFRHDVTILDLLFHTGTDAPWYIWGWRSEPR